MSAVRDRRDADWFWMNKSIMETYGATIGVHGIAIYALLASHANQEGKAIPSIRTIARKLNLSTNTVLRYLGVLSDQKLIEQHRRTSEHGDRTSTEYILLAIPTPAQESVASQQEGVSTGATRVSTDETPISTGETQVSQQVLHRVSTDETEQDLSNKKDLNKKEKEIPLPPLQHMIRIEEPLQERIKDGIKEPVLDVSPGDPAPPLRAPRPSRTKASQTPATNYTPGFQRVWTAYPAARREGKVAVFAIWTQRGLEPRAAEIAEKLERLTLTLWAGREKQYIPMPATWFNQARYEDELPPLGDVQAQEVRSRLSDREYRSFLATQRFMERHNGPATDDPVSARDADVIDHVQYRVD